MVENCNAWQCASLVFHQGKGFWHRYNQLAVFNGVAGWHWQEDFWVSSKPPSGHKCPRVWGVHTWIANPAPMSDHQVMWKLIMLWASIVFWPKNDCKSDFSLASNRGRWEVDILTAIPDTSSVTASWSMTCRKERRRRALPGCAVRLNLWSCVEISTYSDPKCGWSWGNHHTTWPKAFQAMRALPRGVVTTRFGIRISRINPQ